MRATATDARSPPTGLSRLLCPLRHTGAAAAPRSLVEDVAHARKGALARGIGRAFRAANVPEGPTSVEETGLGGPPGRAARERPRVRHGLGGLPARPAAPASGAGPPGLRRLQHPVAPAAGAALRAARIPQRRSHVPRRLD